MGTRDGWVTIENKDGRITVRNESETKQTDLEKLEQWVYTVQSVVENFGVEPVPDNLYFLTQEISLFCDVRGIDPTSFWDICRTLIASVHPDPQGWTGPQPNKETVVKIFRETYTLYERLSVLLVQEAKVAAQLKPQEGRKIEATNPAEPGRESNSVKDRFTFSPGQACFDNKDLHLPTGLAIDVLKKLVESFGKTVGYRELDDNSEAKNASEQLRDAKRKITKALEANKTPCKIETKKGEGYIISPQTTHK